MYFLKRKIQQPRYSFAQIQAENVPTKHPERFPGYSIAEYHDILWQVYQGYNPVKVYQELNKVFDEFLKPKIVPAHVLHPAMPATVLLSCEAYTASIIADPNSVVLTYPKPAPVAEATPDVSTPGTATLRDVIAYVRYILERVFENNFLHSNSMLYEPALLQSAKKLFLILNHMEQSQPRGSPAMTNVI